MKKLIVLIYKIANKSLSLLKLLVLKIQQIYFQIAGCNVECNICKTKARKFHSDNWHLYSICPYCSSGIRQRLLMASLTFLDEFNIDKLIHNKKVLHFAPEKSLGKIIQRTAKEYRTGDLLIAGYSYNKIDYNIDISNMKIIKDESYDCVIACDVLEHVPDHINGIKEVYRILSKGGYCIFTVPQKDNLKVTFEDLAITDAKERERVFGQFDHLRIYGDDFTIILQKCGFDVTTVDENFFDKTIIDRYVLFPPVLSSHPLATNYRKIFFGKKT